MRDNWIRAKARSKEEGRMQNAETVNNEQSESRFFILPSSFPKSHCHVFRPHFETFVLILPNGGGIKIQQLGREFTTGARE